MLAIGYIVMLCYSIAAAIVACACTAPIMLGVIPRPKATQFATWIGWLAVLVCLAAFAANVIGGR